MNTLDLIQNELRIKNCGNLVIEFQFQRVMFFELIRDQHIDNNNNFYLFISLFTCTFIHLIFSYFPMKILDSVF